jgi:hypothetical protein
MRIRSELESMFQQMEEGYRQVSGTVLANESVRNKFAKLLERIELLLIQKTMTQHSESYDNQPKKALMRLIL